MSLTDSILVCTWLSTHCDHRGDSTCFGECLETTAQRAKVANRSTGRKSLWKPLARLLSVLMGSTKQASFH